jgi:UDP-3-O-[3-hydroxymyristoyl] glucosamine N-acyltransferase
MRLDELAEKLECKLEGNPSTEILGVDKIETAGPQMLTFLANRKYLPKLKSTQAGAIITDFQTDCNGKNVLRHSNPYLTYAKALELFYKPYRPSPFISSQAYVASTALIGKDVYIGPFVYVDDSVEIGDRS